MNSFHPLDGSDTTGSSLSVEMLNERLHDQQFYTRSLIESNIDALMTTDRQGVITDVNQQMVELTGRTRDELIGAPCRNFFTNPTRADTAIARVLSEERIEDYELTVRAFDGSETVVSYNAATLRDRERNIHGVFAAGRDVTEHKRLERALLEKNFRMEKANIARAEFLARTQLHVLTPFESMISSSRALQHGVDGALNEAQRQRMDEICAESERLLALLTDLIRVSTVETGTVEFSYEAVDVHSLLLANVALVDNTGDPAVSVVVDGATDVGAFPLDVAYTAQILGVILNNAIVASTGGTVTVHARTVPRNAVGEFNGHRPHWSMPLPSSSYTEFLEIQVADSGVGISESDLPTVFLPLRHREIDSDWESDGHGVGLTMVRLLAGLHDGTVGVAAAPGEGATFAVWLPRRDLPAAPVRTTATVYSQSASPETGTLQAASAEALESPESLEALEAPESPESPESPDASEDPLLPLPQPPRQHSVAAARPDSPIALQGLAVAVAGLSVPRGTSTALVVEDDPKSAKLVRLLLEAEGFQVMAALSGEDALDLARRVPLSLITLDLQLPGMDGWKFLLKLHDSPVLASIPVVVIAGLTDMSMALNRGAAAVLEKPLQRGELQKSLTLLGLRPDRSHRWCILVVDDGNETVDQISSYLQQPAYRVTSSATEDAAITDALRLTPDLILVNLMMEGLGGFKTVRALQEHVSTRHIPVLVMSGGQITEQEQEQDTLDGDPTKPVGAMIKPDFNREALLAEIRRALG